MRVVVLANIRKKCHVWTGKLSKAGYPVHGRGPLYRKVYEAAKGKVPKGKQVHHICENKPCINPDHLVALTPKQHRAAHRKATCPRGHLRTAENTYRYGKRRRCRACEVKATRAKRFIERYQRGVQI